MEEHKYKHAGAILFVIAFSSLLATFNETMLNVALNPLMQSFSINYTTVQWVVTINMLVIAVMIPIAGFLYRRIGSRVLVIGSLAVALVGSLVGVFANSFPMLLGARVIQAMGTGITMPVTMALTLAIAPRNKLGTYMGIVSVLTTLGPSAGPIASGFVLAGTNDWHMLFVMFAVLVALCMVCAILFVPNANELDNPTLDIISVVEISFALVGIMYGITAAFSGGAMVACISGVIGVVALVLFIRRQLSIEQPLLDLCPFKVGGYRIGMLMMGLAFITTFSMNIIIPLYLQSSLDFTAFAAALVLLPATICSTIAAPVGGHIFDRFGIRILLPTAFALIIVGTALIGQTTTELNTAFLTAIFVPVVIGTNLATSPAQSFALSRLSLDIRNHGVTMVAITLQIAGCIGSSAFVGIMSSVQASQVSAGISLLLAQTSAFDFTCYTVCAVGVVGLLLALFTGSKVKQGVVGYIDLDSEANAHDDLK